MKLEKIILLLDRENNDDLLDYVIPFIREYSSIVYFLYVIEIPVKYDIDYEVGNEISLGETILSLSLIHISEPTRPY